MKKVAYVVIMFPAFIVLWAVIIGMWAVELALGAAALVGIFALPIAKAQGKVWEGRFLFGGGLVLAGFAIVGFYACLYVSKRVCVLSKKVFCFIKSCFIGREAVR